MRFIARAAAALLLTIHALAAAANTLCLLNGKVYYGTKAFDQARAENDFLKGIANSYPSDVPNFEYRLCPSNNGSATERAICDKEANAGLPRGHRYVKIQSGLNLSGGTSAGKYGSDLTEDQRRKFHLMPNEFNDLRNPVIYDATVLHEYWEVDFLTGGSKARFLQKVGSGTSEPFNYILCGLKKNTFAFINGVFISQSDARRNLRELAAEFGDEYKGSILDYQLLYNDTTCDGQSRGTCLGDLAETFTQRQSQIDAMLRGRWEIFWDMVSGRHTSASSITGSLLRRLGATGNLLAGLDASLRNKMAQLITAAFTARENYNTQWRLFWRGIRFRTQTKRHLGSCPLSRKLIHQRA